ncbi:Alkylated DNA repair alkB -like protein, partial [Brachionus plicatilis]
MNKKIAEHSPGPKPERAIFGFFLIISSIILLSLYALISFIPNSVLAQIGWTYLPDKYWSLAVPAVIIYGVLGYLPIYFSINTTRVNDYSSIYNIEDEHSHGKQNQPKKDQDSIDPAYDIPIGEINNFLFNDLDQIKSLTLLKNTDCVFLENLDKNENFNVVKLNFDNILDEQLKKVGLKASCFLNCYELKANPGLLVIPNPFLNSCQRFLVTRCLAEYHNRPNKTNLDLHKNRDGNLWNEAIGLNNFNEFNKLRWATIGYHYDWTNKVYNEMDYTEPPQELKTLSEIIASLIGFPNFKLEAGIINYYHLNSTLSAHQDRSEKNMSAPLLSISLGSSAVFLIGKECKSEVPAALLLRSGDVVIMSSKSRLSFHAVPTILPDPNVHSYFEIDDDSTEDKSQESNEWNDFYNYIKINRININIRQ